MTEIIFADLRTPTGCLHERHVWREAFGFSPVPNDWLLSLSIVWLERPVLRKTPISFDEGSTRLLFSPIWQRKSTSSRRHVFIPALIAVASSESLMSWPGLEARRKWRSGCHKTSLIWLRPRSTSPSNGTTSARCTCTRQKFRRESLLGTWVAQNWWLSRTECSKRPKFVWNQLKNKFC